MARSPASPGTPKQKREVKPKTAFVVLEGISAEALKAANPRVVLSDSEMLEILSTAMDEGKSVSRVKVVIPVKRRAPASA